MAYLLFFAFIFIILWLTVSHIDSRDSNELSIVDKIEKKALAFQPFIQLLFVGIGFVFLISAFPMMIVLFF